MIEIIAAILIAIGIYFIIRGLVERFDFYDGIDEYKIREHKLKERELREFRWVGEKTEEDEFKPKKKVKTGGVILIGPIPIVFGDSKYAFYALILAIVLMLLSIFFIFSFY